MKYLLHYKFNILSFILIFGLVCAGFQSISQSTQHQERESLEKALKRGILECYALEGRYPESLTYLIDHYHIFYDYQQFDIKYEVIASNMMPNVTIIEKR